MSTIGILSAVLLGISVIVSAIRLLEWWLNSDPKAVIRTGRWLALIAAFASIPGLALLIADSQWVPAMLLGAGMIFAATFLDWRRLLPRRRTAFRPLWTDEEEFAAPPRHRTALRQRHSLRQGPGPDDPELVARAAAVLESYLAEVEDRRLSQMASQQGEMSAEEAYDVLGLQPGADAFEIREAHRRLVQFTHPDRGGSKYLTAKINQARAVLLAARDPRTRSA